MHVAFACRILTSALNDYTDHEETKYAIDAGVCAGRRAWACPGASRWRAALAGP